MTRALSFGEYFDPRSINSEVDLPELLVVVWLERGDLSVEIKVGGMTLAELLSKIDGLVAEVERNWTSKNEYYEIAVMHSTFADCVAPSEDPNVRNWMKTFKVWDSRGSSESSFRN